MSEHSNTPSTSNLGRVAKRSLAAMLTGRGVVVLTNLGAAAVLARLLEPRDFGIFGIAMLFTGLANRFGNIGLGSALIQRKEIRDEHVSSLFTLNIVIFPLFCGALVLASPVVGSFFDTPEAGNVLVISSLVFFTSPFSSVSRALLRRQMEFKWIALAGVANHLIGSIVSIILAWKGLGVWSLVYGRLSAALVSATIMTVRSRWLPRLGFSGTALKELFPFGSLIFLKNLLIYGSNKVDYFIIAKQMGPAAFGLYEKAFNIMDLAVKQVGQKVAGGVLFSAFSRLQGDLPALRRAYVKLVLTLSLICVPFFTGLFLVAPSLVYILFGEKWLPSVVPLQIMSVAGLLRMYMQTVSTVVNSMGKVGAELHIRVAALVLLALGCWYGTNWGLAGVSVAVAVTTLLLTGAMISYLGRLTGLTWVDFLRPQLPVFAATTIMFAVVWLYQRGIQDMVSIHSALMLFSSAAIGAVTYTAVLGILRPRAIVSLLKGIVADLRPAAKQATGR